MHRAATGCREAGVREPCQRRKHAWRALRRTSRRYPMGATDSPLLRGLRHLSCLATLRARRCT
ncbi:hypothetical protein OH687_32595 [Burkholderia anthina]|nr:hypothetical protein OH687_32595 [Burkholderia anthina]